MIRTEGRRTASFRAAPSRSRRRRLAPLLLGLSLCACFPTQGAYQDIGSLVAGTDSSGTRWTAYVQRAAAGSLQAADMPFRDGNSDAANLSGAGRSTADLGTVALSTGKGKAATTPDEARVVRSEKRGRLLRVSLMEPAGSAADNAERTAEMLRPAIGTDVAMAFAGQVAGSAQAVAVAFQAAPKKPAIDPSVPPMLAALVTNTRADVLATAYAAPEPGEGGTSPFVSLLGQEEATGSGRFIPPLEPGDHAWMATALPPSVFSPAEQTCLATGIYYEARGEKLRGQAAVAQVILNRVRNPSYPKSICGVVYQNQHMHNACQFSFACDGIKDRITNPRAYRVAQDVAMAVTAGKIFIPEIGSSTHYFADYVSPGWARAMEKMKKIGRHIFFRTYGGGWS